MIDKDQIRNKLKSKIEPSLCSWAQRYDGTKGRTINEEDEEMRLCYQLDRDRIIYTAAFRQLKGKTQVFVRPVQSEARTRLTHTLEVTQIARSAARALDLNEDLVEAIGLGHDIGHTPFGHAGEDVLDTKLESGFHHSQQSLRVVEHLANDGEGLNLTYEVKDGISKHSKGGSIQAGVSDGEPATAEAMLVRYCDSIAYINHDIDDAILEGMVTKDDLPNKAINVLGEKGGERIETAILDIVEQSEQKKEITMSDDVLSSLDELRDFMFENVYYRIKETPRLEEARAVMAELFDYFVNNPDEMYTIYPFLQSLPSDVPRIVADFLSLHTDRGAVKLYKRKLGKNIDFILK